MPTFGENLQDQSEEDIFRKLNNHSLEAAPVYLLEILKRRTEQLNKGIVNLNKSIDKFNESSEDSSRKVLMLSVVLFFVAIFQLFATIIPPQSMKSKVGWVAFSILAIAWMFKEFFKDFKLK